MSFSFFGGRCKKKPAVWLPLNATSAGPTSNDSTDYYHGLPGDDRASDQSPDSRLLVSAGPGLLEAFGDGLQAGSGSKDLRHGVNLKVDAP